MATSDLRRRPDTLGLVLCCAAVALTVAWFAFFARPADALVVYCAHDLVFAEPILREFERQTGIPVAIQGDTEATKSLGLVEQILREQDHPRCDVFWNNQVLGTVRLQDAGALEPFRGAGFERIPPAFKDPEGHWAGFAARLRVWIVNTNQMPATETAIQERLAGDDLSRMAIALPIYGTTLSHYAVLWDAWGEEQLKTWHRDLVRRGCRVVSGNATVKNLVAAGICDFGMTDTDDFFVAKDEGKPVAMLPIRVDGRTICIPNSVAVVHGTKRREPAQQLVDFLLSRDGELQLAQSAARQIPLGPVGEAPLPADVQELARWARESVAIRADGAAREACLAWLKSEYAP